MVMANAEPIWLFLLVNAIHSSMAMIVQIVCGYLELFISFLEMTPRLTFCQTHNNSNMSRISPTMFRKWILLQHWPLQLHRALAGI